MSENPLDLSYNDSPVCPYCGTELSDAWELELEHDGDATTIECGNEDCEREFEVTLNVSYSYTTRKNIDACSWCGEPHEGGPEHCDQTGGGDE